MKVLVFDNYDSFTYNLVHMVEHILNKDVVIVKNDEISIEDVNAYDKIICSPGPGLPAEAGLLMQLIEKYASTKSILGVCLGHQAIVENFGGTITNLPTVYHGVSMDCRIIRKAKLFKNIPDVFKAGRYHSWTACKEDFPSELSILAEDEFGNIMAAEHKFLKVCGVQFHPESILTPLGKQMLENWLHYY